MREARLTIAALVLLLVGSVATADETAVKHYANQAPSTDELIEHLRPLPKTRGLKLKKRPSVSLGIQFEFDSHDLTDEARQTLSALGEAMRSPELRGFPFLIEGHTDHVGGESYNQGLSERRALSVKQFLVRHFSIDETSLTAVGRGESVLLDREDPAGDINRRFQVINLDE